MYNHVNTCNTLQLEKSHNLVSIISVQAHIFTFKNFPACKALLNSEW